jgi:hypothetical protein
MKGFMGTTLVAREHGYCPHGHACCMAGFRFLKNRLIRVKPQMLKVRTLFLLKKRKKNTGYVPNLGAESGLAVAHGRCQAHSHTR